MRRVLALLVLVLGAAQAVAQNRPVTLINASPLPILNVYLRGAGTANWGNDTLGEGVVVPAGQRAPIQVPLAIGCRVDVMVVAFGGPERPDPTTGVEICETTALRFEAVGQPLTRLTGTLAPVAPPAQSAAPGRFTVSNASGQIVTRVLLRPPGGAWAMAREASILRNTRAEIPRPAGCRYEVRIVLLLSGAIDLPETDLCAQSQIVVSGTNALTARVLPADDTPTTGKPGLSVVNDGPVAIQRLYVWPAGGNDRGPDRLGEDVLDPAKSVEPRLDEARGCRWTVQAEYAGNRRGQAMTQDFCPPAVVRLSPPAGITYSGGSGFFVSADGHVVTNNHVVNGCPTVWLRLNGQEAQARVLRVNRDVDLALLQVAGLRAPALPLRDPSLAPRPGETAVVVGYPRMFERGGQLTTIVGRVAARRGEGALDSGGDPTTFLYNADDDHGNSGGPILDGAGRVIGVVVRDTKGGGKTLSVGIQLSQVLALARAAEIALRTTTAGQRQEPEDIADQAAPSVPLLLCRT